MLKNNYESFLIKTFQTLPVLTYSKDMSQPLKNYLNNPVFHPLNLYFK
jgi:hypothetical protein